MRVLLPMITRIPKWDIVLLGIMTMGAACGIIYEYLISHYAGRIIGSYDTAVYGIIGIMVASMGLGAFYARAVKCPYTGFAWLEAGIALIGGSAVLMMAGLYALAYILPLQLQHAFGLHQSISLDGGIVFVARMLAESFPYIMALIIGVLIGMEIPFIARIREDLYEKRLEHNAGTVYGMDYIGGGIGAALWIFVCLSQPIILSAGLTALLNAILGAFFLAIFYKKVKGAIWLVAIKLGVTCILGLILFNGTAWMNAMSNMLYTDRTVYSVNTQYQHIVVTERPLTQGKPSIIQLYLNGHLQFSSSDEVIYHSFLVTPALSASARQDNILIIGGGDGLAAKEVLQWNPKSVTLVDLDPQMTQLFQGKLDGVPPWLNQRLLSLNANALNDERVKVINDDAFLTIEQFAAQGDLYDAIIVDLPDPNHPDLNKLYSAYFYAKLRTLLSPDGAMVVQSTSPFHSQKAFISIGKTMASVGLMTDQYHTNVPTFGQWGWSLATKQGVSPKERLHRLNGLSVDHDYLSYEQLMGSFEFSKGFYEDKAGIKVNYLNAPTLYAYHSDGWKKQNGIYLAK